MNFMFEVHHNFNLNTKDTLTHIYVTHNNIDEISVRLISRDEITYWIFWPFALWPRTLPAKMIWQPTAPRHIIQPMILLTHKRTEVPVTSLNFKSSTLKAVQRDLSYSGGLIVNSTLLSSSLKLNLFSIRDLISLTWQVPFSTKESWFTALILISVDTDVVLISRPE